MRNMKRFGDRQDIGLYGLYEETRLPSWLSRLSWLAISPLVLWLGISRCNSKAATEYGYGLAAAPLAFPGLHSSGW